jgi:hypothetical protein
MRIINNCCFLIIALAISSCSGISNKTEKILTSAPKISKTKYDKRSSIQKLYIDTNLLLNEFKKTPEIEAIEIKVKKDTLVIVVKGWFFYYPFGKFYNKRELTSIGSNVTLKEEMNNNGTESDTTRLYTVRGQNSFVKFVQGDSKKFDIVSGEIKDINIKLSNGVGVGMSLKSFLSIYFKHEVDNMLSNINVIEFDSALVGIWHFYDIKLFKINKIRFDSDYVVNKN